MQLSVVWVAEALLYLPSSAELFACSAPAVFLVGCSLGVTRRFVSYVGRFLVVAGLWWYLRRWCCLIDWSGCRFAHARVRTGLTTYPAMRLLFLFVVYISRVGCSLFPAVVISCGPSFVCAVLLFKVGLTPCSLSLCLPSGVVEPLILPLPLSQAATVTLRVGHRRPGQRRPLRRTSWLECVLVGLRSSLG
jgi:hypothetical protein